MKTARWFFISLFCLAALHGEASLGEKVTASLVQEMEQVVPGQEFRLLLDFHLASDWHLYWKNPGDSGMAPCIEWRLPKGVSLVSEEWPVPKKGDQNGIISYFYEDRLPLIAQFRIDADVKEKEIPISADLSFVVCSNDTCMPGSLNVKGLIHTGAESAVDHDSRPLFEAADQQMAEKLSPLFVEQNGNLLVIALPIRAPKEIDFYPESDIGIDPHEKLGVQGFDEEGYTLVTLKASVEKFSSVRGVLVADDKKFDLQPFLPSVESDPLISAVDLPKQVGEAVSKLPSDPQDQEGLGLGWALLFSLLGGLILNLMPCVLPVVSLKVLSFVQMAGESRKEIFKHGALFSMGVLVSFWTLAGALILLQKSGQAVGWGFQLQEPLFIALLAIIFLLLGLSLFGLFEFGTSIAAMAGDASSPGGKGGSASSFTSGVFATAVATPCTGPFMGSALGYALTQPPVIALLVFTALGIGMSLPYLLLAVNPAWIRLMPKPGAWMESFKQIMGFLMMATILWLLWVFAGQTGETSLFMLQGALLVASVAAWIYGKWGAPYKAKKTRRIAYFFAGAVLCFSLWISYQASVESETGAAQGEIASAENGWEPFSRARIEELRAQNIPVFIDFTAKWCLICQANHMTVVGSSVNSKMQEKGVVKMKADWTKYDPVITEELKSFGRSGVPLYVYYGSSGKEAEILPQLLTADTLIDVMNRDGGKQDVR